MVDKGLWYFDFALSFSDSGAVGRFELSSFPIVYEFSNGERYFLLFICLFVYFYCFWGWFFSHFFPIEKYIL